MPRREFERINELNQAHIERFKESINSHEQAVQSYKVSINDLNYEIKQKATQDDLDKLLKEQKKYVHENEIIDIRDRLIPALKESNKVVDGFREDNENFKQIIRRFDEILLDKANKS